MNDLNKEFPSNSRIQKKDVRRVTTGSVRRRKEPMLYKLFSGQSVQDVADYILWDVLLPAAKSTLSDVVTNAINMLLYNSSSTPKSPNLVRSRDRTYVSYNSIYRDRQTKTETRSRNRASHRFDDIVFGSRADAEVVLSQLVELIDTYETATVADFYDLVGLNGEWSDNQYGWDNLSKASIIPVRGGYILDLPPTILLD